MKYFLTALILITLNSDNKLFEISGNFNGLSLDAVDNLIVTTENEVQKYNPKGELQFSYSNLEFGEPSSIQSNSLQNNMIFYKDFNKIIFLDNKLSLKTDPIDLLKMGFYEIDAVCMSYDNGFWIFDPTNQKIIRFDRFLNQSNISENIDQYINSRLNVIKMKESTEFLVLFDKESGLYIFDKYGSFLFGLDKKNIKDFDLVESKLYYVIENNIFMYNIGNHSNKQIEIKIDSIKKFSLSQNRLAVLKDNKIELYKH